MKVITLQESITLNSLLKKSMRTKYLTL